MPSHRPTDVLIAGGGLLGMLSAYYLVNRGLSVRLLDAGELGREASWAGGGILWPLYAWRYPLPVQALARVGRQIYPDLCQALKEDTGIDPEYQACGMLVCDRQAEHEARQWLIEEREPWAELPPGEQGRPELAVPYPVLHLPEVAQVRNPRLCEALAVWLRARGVLLHEQEAVSEIIIHNGKFCGMRSRLGIYEAGCGIVATGAWSSRLLPRLDIFPVKGEMILLRGKPGLLNQMLLCAGRYIIPRADGHILVGSTVEQAGFDTDKSETTAQELKAFAQDLMPALASLPIVKHWAGLRPATPSGVPYIGAVPGIEELYINAGHYRNGVVAAPASAQLLADSICDSETQLSLADYSVPA